MITAFVLIITQPGKEADVRAGLSQHQEVAESKTVYGDYDVVVKVCAESMDQLNTFMLDKMRRVSNIKATTTLIAL